MMDTKPLHPIIDLNATLVAYRARVPVLVHWQEEVKAGLDQDIRLGVIEPIAIGEPVTWCHRMVIRAKRMAHPDKQQASKLLLLSS